MNKEFWELWLEDEEDKNVYHKKIGFDNLKNKELKK